MAMLDILLIVAGLLHLGLVGVGFSAAKVLNWRKELRGLATLSRQLIWVHGGFIVATIIAFGLASIFLPSHLTEGTALSRFVCGFIGLFWLARLVIALFFFDASEQTKSLFLKLGYHGLTVVFGFFVAVYGFAAVLA
jgi:hypothetical protein